MDSKEIISCYNIMDYSKLNSQMMVLAVLIVTAVFFTYTRSFNNDVPSCDGYVTNVYLYVLLGLLITAFSVLFISKRRYAITTTKSLLAFAVAIIAIFSMYMTNPSRVLLNHALWLTFIISMSVALYVVWRYSDYRGSLTSTLIIVSLMISGLVLISHLKPEWINLGWISVITTVLLATVLAWIVPLFLKSNIPMTNYYKFLSAVFVMIFMMLILYDTKVLRVKAEKCIIPDYPTDSLGLFLDVVNLFNNVAVLRA